MKNILARGCGRRQIFLSKYLISLAASLLMSLVTVAVAYGCGRSVWGTELPVTDSVPLIVLGQVLGIAAYHALFFAISYTAGKTGSAIAMNIVVPLAVSLVLGMGDAFIRSEKFRLSEYWLDPLYKNFTAAATESAKTGVGIVLFLAYLAAAVVIGISVNRKKELYRTGAIPARCGSQAGRDGLRFRTVSRSKDGNPEGNGGKESVKENRQGCLSRSIVRMIQAIRSLKKRLSMSV